MADNLSMCIVYQCMCKAKGSRNLVHWQVGRNLNLKSDEKQNNSDGLGYWKNQYMHDSQVVCPRLIAKFSMHL